MLLPLCNAFFPTYLREGQKAWPCAHLGLTLSQD